MFFAWFIEEICALDGKLCGCSLKRVPHHLLAFHKNWKSFLTLIINFRSYIVMYYSFSVVTKLKFLINLTPKRKSESTTDGVHVMDFTFWYVINQPWILKTSRLYINVWKSLKHLFTKGNSDHSQWCPTDVSFGLWSWKKIWGLIYRKDGWQNDGWIDALLDVWSKESFDLPHYEVC